MHDNRGLIDDLRVSGEQIGSGSRRQCYGEAFGQRLAGVRALGRWPVTGQEDLRRQQRHRGGSPIGACREGSGWALGECRR